jgi:hypothetical protein
MKQTPWESLVIGTSLEILHFKLHGEGRKIYINNYVTKLYISVQIFFVKTSKSGGNFMYCLL